MMSRAPVLSLSEMINLASAVHGVWVNLLKSSLQLSFVVDVQAKVALVHEVVELFPPTGLDSPDTDNLNVVNVRWIVEYIEKRLNVRGDRRFPTVNQREVLKGHNPEYDFGVYALIFDVLVDLAAAKK
jgi:hypothetical protein